MKSLGKTFSLDSGPSPLTVGINGFSSREINHCVHSGQENHPLQPLSDQAQHSALQNCLQLWLAMARGGLKAESNQEPGQTAQWVSHCL